MGGRPRPRQGAFMNLTAEDYEPLKDWLSFMLPLTMPEIERGSEFDPILLLDSDARRSPSRALRGLALAIGDTLEMTGGWSPGQIARADDALAAADLPSLTAVRLRFDKAVAGIVRRGCARNDAEYRLARAAAENRGPDQAALLAIINAFEGL